MEAGIALDTSQVQGDDRDLFHVGLFQGPADKTHIVGGAAAASGLGHDNRCFVKVVSAGEQCFHDLPHHQKGGVAGVIVDILQPHVHGVTVIVVKDDEMITAGIEGRLQDFKVDGGHLRADDGVFSPHFLGEGHFLDGGGLKRTLFVLFFPNPDGGKQRADTDSRGTQIVYLVDL